MRTHIVKQGEDIDTIAYQYGMNPDSIWNDDKNSELKEKRESGNVLMPGDEIEIPDPETKEEEVITGEKHRFRRVGTHSKLQLQFFDEDEKPRAGVPYILKIISKANENYPIKRGDTDGDGFLIKVIPSDTSEGVVILDPGDDEKIIPFKLGHIDPPDESITGIKAMLTNLGYECGDIEDDTLDFGTREAIRAFQEDNDLEPLTYDSDEISQETVNKLKEQYSA